MKCDAAAVAGVMELMETVINSFDNNYYQSIVAYDSQELTKIGQKPFQQSVESYVYAVLGAQAKTRWSIVNLGAKSSQTQDVFHKLVEDTIAQSDTTMTISDRPKPNAKQNDNFGKSDQRFQQRTRSPSQRKT